MEISNLTELLQIGWLGAAATFAAIAPQNATETMLVVQMIAVHDAALMYLKRSTVPEQTTDTIDSNVCRATRLMSLFKEQLEALQKLKGKASQQKVTVEHVHVHSGGQAIVGTVTAGDRKTTREGEMNETVGKPHEKRRGVLRNGNPSGDLSAAARCGAKNRQGTRCQSPAMRNGRCRLHGGLSTGPKTPEGIERIRQAVSKHGYYSARAVMERKRFNALLLLSRRTIAALS